MKYLKVERDEDVVQITISRQDKLNAMNLDVMDEFISLLDDLEKDSSRVIIITGEGPKAFSAGADIEYMSNIGPTEAEKYALRGHEVLNRIEKLEKPVIAAVNGYALGGGCELALSCDIRFASPNAQLGQPEVTLGICPGWGGTQRLLRIVGPARAKDLIFSGRKIMAEEALSMGLINKIFPSESLLSETKAYAKVLSKNSSFAIGISKMLVNRGTDANLDTGLKLEIYSWAVCFSTKEREERMRKFIEKK
ncbi:MAG: enoyl-CoA hydratase-related protein [Candidatus Nitrosotalea sp.]|jgi:3-hydroxypropionyl-coenzyme A dehydratase|nr:enoyl-CoA hydratase-related protein [Candidatus Nitrosotalea sp.]